MTAPLAPTLTLVIAACAAAPAAAQARVEALAGVTHNSVLVTRLGSLVGEPPRAGMELLPGDLISASSDSALVELSCALRNRTSTYRLQSPFRVLIDVPADSVCHVNLLAGRADVLAETPTQTTAGGITLGSSGTQYTVEVLHTEAGAALRCLVYDGRMRVISRRSGIQINAGTNLVWEPDGGVRRQRNSRTELQAAAALYARFDVARAAQQDSIVFDPQAAAEQLEALHLEVLLHPADTARRVQLARRQLDLNVRGQAIFNLRRVDVTSDARLRAHNIDPARVRSR